MKAKRLNEEQMRQLHSALKTAREISTLDRTDEPGRDGYAYALGRANGLADNIVIQLEWILGVKK